MTRTSIAFALAASTLISALGATAATAAPITKVVSPHDRSAMTTASVATGKGRFVNDAAAPLGSGAYEMTVGAGAGAVGGRHQLSFPEFAGKTLLQLETFSFATKLAGGTDTLDHFHPGFQMAVDGMTPTPENPTGFTTLVFETAYQDVRPVKGTWQTWSAFTPASKWWSTRAIPGVCAKSCYVSWPAIVAANPNLKVQAAGAGLVVGENSNTTAWQQATNSVDAVTVKFRGADATTYDYDRRLLPLSSSSQRTGYPHEIGLNVVAVGGATAAVTTTPATPFAGVGGLKGSLGKGRDPVGGRVTLNIPGSANRLLRSLTDLGLDSYQWLSSPGIDSLAFGVVIPVSGLSATTQEQANGARTATNLVFEPTYDTVSSPFTKGQWIRRDALEGRWWSTQPINGVCAKACYVEWQDIVGAHPNAVIDPAGLSFSAGQDRPGVPWTDFVGTLDSVVVGFDRARVAVDIDPLPSQKLNRSVLDFGDRLPATGPSSARTASVKNFGSGPGRILSFRTSGAHTADFALSHSCTGVTVQAGNSCVLSATFEPQGEGARQATVTITTDNLKSPTFKLTLKGFGGVSEAPSTSPLDVIPPEDQADPS